jgi:periplasmic protein TonB
MEAAGTQEADRHAFARLPSALARRRDRVFWIALSCAAILHAAVIVGFVSSNPKRMGERDGDPNAISVDLIEASDMPGQPAIAARSGSDAPAREAERQEAQPPQPPQPPQPQPSRPAEPLKSTPFPLDKEGLFPPSGQPAEKTAPPKTAARPPQPQQKSGGLQLDLPDFPMSAVGRNAAVGRPANITRSGENDDFGRGVVRALRQTMPAPRGVLGRVTIRLLLSESGNLLETQLIKSGGDPTLDQSVVFAAKQSSFPIPPAGSTVADRTFLVTYIYH